MIHRNQCVFHRPATASERRHQIRNFLLTLHLNCQRVLLVNCVTYYCRIFEVDTGPQSTHIFFFLKACVTFIIIWPLLVLVHEKRESFIVPSLSEYVVIFLKNFSNCSKIFHGSPSPYKSHVNYIYLFATPLCVYVKSSTISNPRGGGCWQTFAPVCKTWKYFESKLFQNLCFYPSLSLGF